MKIRILTVGKIKEKFYRDAIAEYQKRLGRYCKLEIVEVADEKTDENASPSQMEQVKEKEGQRLLSHIRDGEYCIVLAIEGKKLDSVAFSQQIDRLMVSGTSTIDFVIGGSLGLYKDVLSRADFLLSFSDRPSRISSCASFCWNRSTARSGFQIKSRIINKKSAVKYVSALSFFSTAPHTIGHEQNQKITAKTDSHTGEGGFHRVPASAPGRHAGREYPDADRRYRAFGGKLPGNPGIYAGVYSSAGEA